MEIDYDALSTSFRYNKAPLFFNGSINSLRQHSEKRVMNKKGTGGGGSA